MRGCRWIGVVVDNVLRVTQKKSPASGLFLAKLRTPNPDAIIGALVSEQDFLRQYSSDNAILVCLVTRD
jgi:hypothetical protein